MPSSAAAESAAALPRGETIDRYVVLGLVGRGGMGEVYAAYDPELDRKIAVKLLRARAGAGRDSADGRTRLLREAQAIAKLSHPNVVVVYDVGTFGDSVFIAMEFVEGHTAGYWMHAQTEGVRRDWRQVLKTFLMAGRGLVAAHEAGLVHRDFKPDNVMVSHDGHVRVMDFGLARMYGEDDDLIPSFSDGRPLEPRVELLPDLPETLDPNLDPDATAQIGAGGSGNHAGAMVSGSGGFLRAKLTQTGALMGTPAYMAPEQFAAQRTDARTDQFSFCVALYEGLYGERPFAGDSVVSLMANVVSGTVSDAPDKARVPAWLRKVLLRGLKPDPNDRWPSMAALLAALEHDPARARRRWLLAAAGVAAVAAVSATAWRAAHLRPSLCGGAPQKLAGVWDPGADSPVKQAIRRAFSATGKPYAAEAFASVSRLLDRYLGEWTAMYTDACEATHVRGEQSAEVLDLRMSCLGERLGQARALTEVLSQANATVVENAVSAAGALPPLDRCADVKLLRAVVPPPQDAGTRAAVEALRGELDRFRAVIGAAECTSAMKTGQRIADAAARLGYLPLRAEALSALGTMTGNACADPATALAQHKEAFYAAQAARHEELAVASSGFVAMLYADRQHDARSGRDWARHGDAILAHIPGHPVLEAWQQMAWGTVLFAEGKSAEALAADQRALALKERALGPDHADTLLSRMNVALRLHTVNRDEEANAEMTRTLTAMRQVLGPEHNIVALTLVNHGEILSALRRYEDARRAFEGALAIWKGNSSSFYVGYALLQLGETDLAAGDPAGARAALQEALVSLTDEADLNVPQARFGLARALWPVPAERSRALDLARNARAAYARAAGQQPKVAELDAWLHEHARP